MLKLASDELEIEEYYELYITNIYYYSNKYTEILIYNLLNMYIFIYLNNILQFIYTITHFIYNRILYNVKICKMYYIVYQFMIYKIHKTI